MVIVGTMTFVREKTRKTKSGDERTYFYLCESVRGEDGPRQKVLAYLGSSPYKQNWPLDPTAAATLAQLIVTAPPMKDLMKALKGFGVNISGQLKSVALVYRLDKKKFSVRVEHESN